VIISYKYLATIKYVIINDIIFTNQWETQTIQIETIQQEKNTIKKLYKMKPAETNIL